jgi:hypothetical protein
VYRYLSRVRVKAGFYQGQIGTVFEEEQRGTFTKYLVLFDGGGSFWFYKSEIEEENVRKVDLGRYP